VPELLAARLHCCIVGALRIDAAGYQTKIIKHCDEKNILYAIRATSSATIKETIASLSDTDWQPLLDKQGDEVKEEATFRTTHCIGDYEKPFTLVIQRKAIQGQTELDLAQQEETQEISAGGYIPVAIEISAFIARPLHSMASLKFLTIDPLLFVISPCHEIK
jgi:hypothetical protein